MTKLASILIVAITITGCSTGFLPSPAKPETVYDPPPMLHEYVVSAPEADQWRRALIDLGYSESEAIARGEMLARRMR